MSEDKNINPKVDEPTTAPLVPGTPVPGTSENPAVKPPDGASETADGTSPDPLDEAVDDITKQESDAVLAAEDEQLAKAFQPVEKQNWRDKLKELIRRWWNNPKARYGSLAGLAVLIILALAIPPSRYFILNTVGVRSSAKLTVLDASTTQPLKHVHVSLAGQSGQTNSDGQVTLRHLKLGRTDLKIVRRAFAVVDKKVTLGWGSNPLGSYSLTPTGSQYSFQISDFLSGRPIGSAEAVSGQAEAQADQKGRIVLTVDPSDASSPLKVVIKAKDYRAETVSFNPEDKASRQVKMVPSQKHIYVSRQATGHYDLYSVDVDGRNPRMLLAGTGYERSDMSVVPQPADGLVAVVSTGQNKHNKDGYLLSTLSIIDTSSGKKTDLASSEKIQVMGWVGHRLIYVQIAAGASAANPTRQRLMSYDTVGEYNQQLATSNHFNDVIVADRMVYYAPSDAYHGGPTGLFKINPDGNGKGNLIGKQVWNIFRDKYDHFNLSVGQDWYGYKLGDGQTNKLATEPANLITRIYQDSPDGKHSLWVDNRDGKGVLLEYDKSKSTDKSLVKQSGLTTPVYWLNNKYVVYRIKTDQQTADYVLNLDGGQPHKIVDVTNLAGVTKWYYY